MSCTTSRQATTITHQSDLHSYERQIDTVVKTVTDSSTIRALLECDSIGRVRVANLKVQNSILQNQLFEIEDNILKVNTQTTLTERVREIVKTDTARIYIEVPVMYPQTKEVNRLMWWQRYLIYIGVAYILRLAINKQCGREHRGYDPGATGRATIQGYTS